MTIEEWTGARIPENVIDEASNWIAQLDCDEPSAADYADLQTWLLADPQHRQAFQELSVIWAHSSVLKSVADQIEKNQVLPFVRDPSTFNSQENNVFANPASLAHQRISPVLLWISLGLILFGLIKPLI